MRFGIAPSNRGNRDKLFDIPGIRRRIETVLDTSAIDVKKDYESTTATAARKTTFTIIKKVFSRTIGYSNANYYRLDETGVAGGKVIRPKKPGGVLAFRLNYKAKTKPRTLASFNGGPSGDVIFVRKVTMKGFKPRKFTRTIADKWEKWFIARFNREVMPHLRGGK